MNKYKVTYRIHNGWQYNDQKHYDTVTEVIKASNADEAYSIALKRAETPSLIAHDSVSVRRKDIVRIRKEKEELKPYEVTVEFVYRHTVTVSTESPEDAKEAVDDMPLRKLFGRKRHLHISELEDGQAICVTGPDGKTVCF